jgi:hypothetical protein
VITAQALVALGQRVVARRSAVDTVDTMMDITRAAGRIGMPGRGQGLGPSTATAGGGCQEGDRLPG